MPYVEKNNEERDIKAISIAISTKDRRDDLAKLLASLERLDYPKEKIEMVVVEEADNPDPIEGVKYVFIPRLNKGYSYTRNVAVQNCSHEFIAFVDDDCIVTPSWLKGLNGALAGDISGVVGSIKVKECNTIGWCENILGYPGGGLKAIDESGHHTKMTKTIVTANALLKADAIRTIGGFDEDGSLRFGGEDALLARHFHDKGFKLLFNPFAVVYHKPKENLISIFKWAYRTGQGHTLLSRYISGERLALWKRLAHTFSFKICLFVFGMILFQRYLYTYVFFMFMVYFIKVDYNYQFHRRYIKKWSIFLLLPIVKAFFDLGEDFGRIRALFYKKNLSNSSFCKGMPH